MRRFYPSLQLPNTHRDINAIPSTTSHLNDFVTVDDEPMIIDDDSPEGIAESNENDSLETRYNHTRIPLMSSLMNTTENNNDDISTEQQEQIYNENSLRNENNLISEAAGYDSTRVPELDADEAYALQLQQEEYARESLVSNQHPYLPFRVLEDHEAIATALEHPFNSGRTELTDAQYAAQLQAQEGRSNHRFRRPPSPPRIWQGQQLHGPTVNADPNIEFIPPFFGIPRRPMAHSDDDSDDNNPFMNINHPVFQMLAHRSRSMRGNGFPMPSHSRTHRRMGHLQETEDDFGPEDYERLLQLDETIRKKKITKDQINLIPEVKFTPKSNNTDEENKCGVCLELFETNQTLRCFPCKHLYHKECADRWLQENNVCPICREPPIKVQSSTNSRHNRNPHNTRRPPNNNRPHNHRNNNNNNNNNHHSTHHRRGPGPQHQS